MLLRSKHWTISTTPPILSTILSRTMTTVTHGMAQQALKDPAFIAKFPEFKQVTPGPALPTLGCHSCAQRRAHEATQNSFFKVLSTLAASRLKEIKAYFNLTDMLVTVRDANGGIQLKVV